MRPGRAQLGKGDGAGQTPECRRAVGYREGTVNVPGSGRKWDQGWNRT